MNHGTPDLTLPEEVLLLALHPEKGNRLCSARYLGYGMAGAVLAELQLGGHIREDRVRPVVLPGVPPADRRLAGALRSLGEPGAKAPKTYRWVRTAARHMEEPWLTGLVERRAVRAERRRALGLFPYTRYPVGPVDLTSETRRRFEAARTAGWPDPRSRALAALVFAIGVGGVLYPGWGARHQRSAMRDVLDHSWTAKAVRRNIQADKSSGSGGFGGDGGGDGGGGGGGGD
ncbi:GPP34 family phosphoprotein [Streptomyces syringium]|uniref:GOLPH3/VPS74 family protein n=1 Tax=Streptomyces syringium TaxID=76729 RepID=UPI0036D08707